MSKNDKQRALVPRLRFPEFKAQWRRTTIAEVLNTEDRLEKATSFDSDKILTVKLHAKGVVKNERTAAKTGGTNYFKRSAGQFIFSKIDLLNGAFGIVPEELDGFYSSSDVPAFSFSNNHSPTFFLNWLIANYRCLVIERTGTSATLKRVSPDKFLALPILLPSPAEQQKIADCLSSLDDLIAAQRQKLEALRDHKKGLMQQLFPRVGETRPRLRFPEFQDAPTWEIKTLENTCDLKAGDFVRAADIAEERGEGMFPCYGGNGLRGYVTTFTHSGRFVLIGRQGALCGNVNLLDERFHATEHALVATPKSNIYIDWLFYALTDLNLNRFAIGQAQPGLSVSVLNDVGISVPEDEDEQQRIADCLSALDDLITAQDVKLDALRTHKRGLMQQLFPSPEDAAA